MATTKLGLSEKQQALRQTGIGASEIAAVLGLHPTKRPIAVWEEKVGVTAPFAGNEFTEFGQRIERVVAEAYLDRHPGVSIFTPGTLRHEKYSWALASPDRVVVPPGRRAREVWEQLLEIKNVSTFQADAYGEGDDEIPEHFLLQVQWQLEVADLEQATLVPLIGGHDYREYPIRRDRELGEMMLEGAGRFWRDHILTRRPPPIDGSPAYTEYFRRRFPAETAPVLPATEAAQLVIERLREARAAEKSAKQEAEASAQAVKALLGEAGGIEGLCTWKANKPTTAMDLAAALVQFRNEIAMKVPNPEQVLELLDRSVAEFTTQKPGARVLRLSKER